MNYMDDLEIPQVGLVRDLPEATYHSDPCDGPSLSASIAKVISGQSLAHAFLRHSKLGGTPMTPTAAMDKGSACHAMLLGKGAEIAVLDFDSWRAKASKEARDLARENGDVPMLVKEYAGIADAVEAIRIRLKSFGLTVGTDTEVSGFWQEGGAQCRMRMDILEKGDSEIVITDLKTAASAHPDEIQRSIIKYGYDVQHAAYVSGCEHIFPEYAGRVRMQFLFVELERPHAVTPVVLSEGFAQLGRAKWDQAVALWSEALQTGEWPCYTTEPTIISPPVWAMHKQFEDE